MIAKIRYHSEISAIVKIENFAMIEIFAMIAKIRYDSKISGIANISLGLRKFRYHCEIFAMPAKLPIFYCCFLHPPTCIMHLPACYFFILGLMKSMRIHTNSE